MWTTHALPLRVQEQNTNSGCGAKFLCTGDGPTYVILRGSTCVILRAVAGSGRGPRHRQRDSATARRMTPESLFSLTRLRGPTYVILRGAAPPHTYVILRGLTYVILRAVAGSGRGPRHRQRDSATARRMTPESLFSLTRLRGPTYVHLCHPARLHLCGSTYVILRGLTYVILRAVAGSGRGPRHRQRDSATARRMTPESLFSLTRLRGLTYASCAQSQDPGEVRAIASEILRLRAE